MHIDNFQIKKRVIYLFVIDFECLFWNGCSFTSGGVTGTPLTMSCGWGMTSTQTNTHSGSTSGYPTPGPTKHTASPSSISWRYTTSLPVECKTKCYRISIIDYSACTVFNKQTYLFHAYIKYNMTCSTCFLLLTWMLIWFMEF